MYLVIWCSLWPQLSKITYTFCARNPICCVQPPPTPNYGLLATCTCACATAMMYLINNTSKLPYIKTWEGGWRWPVSIKVVLTLGPKKWSALSAVHVVRHTIAKQDHETVDDMTDYSLVFINLFNIHETAVALHVKQCKVKNGIKKTPFLAILWIWIQVKTI